MATDLSGKVVLITGASTGIGAAAARAFAGVGAHVVVHYNASKASAEEVVAGIQANGGKAALVGGDVMVEADIKRVVGEALAAFGGRLDVLINNAGGMLGRIKIEDYTREHVERVLMLNCTQIALFMREVVPVMRKQKSGNIINVTSIAARHGGGGGDVMVEADIKRVVGEALAAFGGRLDVLINNAGGMLGRIKIEDYTREHVERVLMLNCTQIALFMREVVPVMRKQKSGNIINVTSIAARHGGGGGAILYAGAKGFVSTATKGWAKELVGDNIRVNAVSPGVITTPFHDRYSNADQLKAMQATVPMNRLGSPEECAGTFLYLASDAMSGYVTGQIIEVNGGQLMP